MYEPTKLRRKSRKSSVLKIELILIWRYNHQQTMFISLNILEISWFVTSKIYLKNQIFIFLGNHSQIYLDFKPNHNSGGWLDWDFELEFTYCWLSSMQLYNCGYTVKGWTNGWGRRASRYLLWLWRAGFRVETRCCICQWIQHWTLPQGRTSKNHVYSWTST